MNIFNNKVNPFDRLPVEIISEIFSYLPPRARIQAAAVCKVWRAIATDEYCLKKAFVPTQLTITSDSTLWEKVIRAQRHCYSKRDLINKIDRFFRLYPRYNRFWFCSVPNTSSTLTIEAKKRRSGGIIHFNGFGEGDFFERDFQSATSIRLKQISFSWNCPFIVASNIDFSVSGTNFNRELFDEIARRFDGKVY